MDVEGDSLTILPLMLLKDVIEQYIDPEKDEDMHRDAFDVIVTKVCLVKVGGGGAAVIVDDSGPASMFNVKHEEINSHSIHIQDLIEFLQSPLTSDDDKSRHRATLLLAEIFHYKSSNFKDEIMSSTVLHLFITFFCRRLADYPSILPSIHALVALVSYHSSNLDPKLGDVHAIYESIFTELQVQSLAQSIRQKIFDLFYAMLSSNTSIAIYEQKQHGTMILEGLIDAFDGEKDPRCLLIGLKVFREGIIMLTSSMNHELAEKYFNALSCYFPLTFNPAPDDPYGITHEMLIESLEGALGADASLFTHVLPLLLEHLQEDSKLSKIQSMRLLLKLCTQQGPHIINHIGKDIGQMVYDIACGVNSGEDGGPEVMSCALAFITKLSTIISKNMVTNEIVWRSFVEFLLQKVSIEMIGNIELMSTRAAVHIAVAIAKGGIVCCKAVMERLVPVLLPKVKETVDLLQKSIRNYACTDNSTVHDHSHDHTHEGDGCCGGSSSSSGSCCSSSSSVISAASIQIMTQLLRSYAHKDSTESPLSLDFSSMSEFNPIAAYSNELFITLQSTFHVTESQSIVSNNGVKANISIDTISGASDALVCLDETLYRSVPSSLSLEVLAPFIRLVTRISISGITAIWNRSIETGSVVNTKEEGFRSIASSLLMKLASNTNYDTLLQEHCIPVLIECTNNALDNTYVYNIISSIVRQGTPLLLTSILPFITQECLTLQATNNNQLSALQSLINVLPSEPINDAVKSNKNSYDNSRAMEIAGFSKKLLQKEKSVLLNVIESISGSASLVSDGYISPLCSLIRGVMLLLDKDLQTVLTDSIITTISNLIEKREGDRLGLPVVASLLSYLDKDSPFFKVEANISIILKCIDYAKVVITHSNDKSVKDCAMYIIAIVANKLHSCRDLDVLIEAVYQLDKDSSSDYTKTLLIWVARALFMRSDIRCSITEAGSWQDFYSSYLLQSLTLDDNNSFAHVFHILTLSHEYVLSSWGKCNTQLFWKQKLWSRFLPSLLELLKSPGPREQKYLLAICGLACGVNKSVLESSLNELVVVAVRSLEASAVHKDSASSSFRGQCIQLLETLLEFNVEQFAPHVGSVAPELINVCQKEPQAKTRAASLRCLLSLLQLPYFNIHTIKGTVIKGLQKVTDDNKKAIRLLAAKVRNKYITINI